MPQRPTEPQGYAYRLSRARDVPDVPVLRPCDVAHLLGRSVSFVTARDAVIPHCAAPGPKGTLTRMYAWDGVQAYLKTTAVGRALTPTA